MTTFAILHTGHYADAYPEEWSAVVRHFPAVNRSEHLEALAPGTIIIPRYRAEPFGLELEQAAAEMGSTLINTFAQHKAIDDIFTWTDRLGDLTAPAYRVEDMAHVPEGRFFVKGNVSSLKNHGPDAVYADDKDGALELARKVAEHPHLGGQTPVIRPLQDYRLLGVSEHRLPMWNEQRVFLYEGRILDHGAYWGNRDGAVVESPDERFYRAVDTALERLDGIAPFLVLDMAQYSDGHWGVVELNDASHSGFPVTVSPDKVFGALAGL